MYLTLSVSIISESKSYKKLTTYISLKKCELHNLFL